MGKQPYFVKAKTSGTWHIIYPGESRPLCGTRAVLDDTSGSVNIPSSTPGVNICENCRWSRRLGEGKVHISAYRPKVVCTECGESVKPIRCAHYHQKIWQVKDNE